MNVAAFGGTNPPEELPALTVEPVARQPEKTTKKKPAIIKPLTEQVVDLQASLAKSLGVAPGADGYEPDAFTTAISKVHGTLLQVRKDLGEWQSELQKREMALEAAEKALQGRERKAAAALVLAGLGPVLGQPTPVSGAFKRWLSRWLMK